MPYLSINMSPKIVYGSHRSEILRIDKTDTESSNFKSSRETLILRVMN